MARHLIATLLLGWIFTAVAAIDPPSTPAPPTVAATELATPIFLESPASLDAFLARIQSPDFVLLRGDRYQLLLKAGMPVVAAKPVAAPPITRVTIGGTAYPERADLVVEFEVFNDDLQARWVLLRLDGSPLARVAEGPKLLPVRSTPTGAWEVEVSGQGRHIIEVGLTTAVVSNGEERRLELAIPLAATTSLNLTLDEKPIEASLGNRDAIIPQKIPGRSGAKLAVALTPRTALEVSWRVPLEQAMVLPPLLSAQGEIAVDVTADAIRTRARWSITAVRGITRSLQFTLDPSEDLIDLELDNRTLTIDPTILGANRTLVIDLPDPLRQGSHSSSVIFTTRRKLTAGSLSSVRLKGFALAGATLQTGAISLTQSNTIWVEGTAGRGLVRIDPAEDLPAELRSRPGTILAYRFVEQPFELSLKIEPAPATLESRAKTSITVLPDVITTESEFHLRATPGQVFSVQFRVPDDVAIDTLRPDENVESTKLSLGMASDRPEIVNLTKRVLNVRLTSHANDLGVFTIKLVMHQRWGKSSRTTLGMIEPINATSFGGRIAIHRAVGVDVSLADPPGSPLTGSLFLRALAPSPGDWTFPTTPQPGIEPTPLWLTFEGTPSVLPLRISKKPRSVRTETDVRANISREGVEYRANVSIDVINGLLSEIDLIIPGAVDRSWDVSGVEISRRELVETMPEGSRRYTLTLAKTDARRLDLRLRYRTTFSEPLPTNSRRAARFERVRILPEGEGPTRFAFECDPGIDVRMNADGWAPRLSVSLGDTAKEPIGAPISYVAAISHELPEFTARAEPLVAMPSLVINRAIFSTYVGGDELRTTATLRFEVHGADVVIEVPPESRWIQARVNGQLISDVEKVDESGRYRVALPAGAGTMLAVDYAAPAQSKTGWVPLKVDNAIWQTLYWNVSVPSTSAVLGVPAGWTDQNEWYWNKFIWMRQPVLPMGTLQAWLMGNSRRQGADEFAIGGTGHSYLFGRTDGPAILPVHTVSRVLLLALCSGCVGLFGIALVLARPAVRNLIIPVAMLVFIVSIGWDPNISLQVMQSGTLGAAMAIIAAILQRLIDRRYDRGSRIVEASANNTPSAHPQRTTSLVHPPVGADDSTAIRSRPQPSGDRIIIAPPIPSSEPHSRSTTPGPPSLNPGLDS